MSSGAPGESGPSAFSPQTSSSGNTSKTAGTSRQRPPTMTMNPSSSEQRLPPMALSDLPSPFALPSQRSFFGLGTGPGQVDPNAGLDNGREAGGSQRYAYRQPASAVPSTPDTAGSASGGFPAGLSGSGPPSPRMAARMGSISPRAGNGTGAQTSSTPFALPSAAESTSSFGEALGGAGGPAKSPWHHLAAMSGEPTPAIDGKSNMFEFGFTRFGRASVSSAGGEDGAGAGTGSASVATPTRRSPFPPVSRGQSPQIGTPFERLDLNGANVIAQTPSAASAGMADPFALAFPPRRGSASGPSGLNPNKAAAGRSKLPRTPGTPQSVASAPSGEMKLNFPAGLAAPRTSQPGLNLPGQSKVAPPSRLSQNSDVQITPKPMTPSQIGDKTAAAGTAGGDAAMPSRPLILDLRPPSAFSQGRIPGSLSLPIPSTLLKRRTFTLGKVVEMLPPRPARLLNEFEKYQDVVLVDQDSTSAPTGSVMAGLASKIASAAGSDWKGAIYFLKGGVSACGDMELSEGGSEEEEDIDMEPEIQVAGDVDVDAGSGKGSATGSMQSPGSGSVPSGASVRSSSSGNAGMVPGSGRMIGGLGKLAFQQGEPE